MKTTRIINQAQAEALLTIEDCIVAMEETLKEVSQGKAAMHQRNMLAGEKGNQFATMSSSLSGRGIAGCKAIVFPGSEAKKNGTNQGIIPIFDTTTGALLAIVDAECITGVRTAATSAAASKVLAGKQSKTLGILGAGRLGRMHIQALIPLFPIEKVYIWDIVPEATQSLCAWVNAHYDVQAVACATAQQACVDADILSTVSQSATPIAQGAWLKKGCHINAVGACSAKARELDTACANAGRVWADKREAVLQDAGDFLIPLAAGEWQETALVGEIGQVLLGEIPGRETQEEITIFESVGIAVEDLAAAWLIYQKALEQNIGVDVEI